MYSLRAMCPEDLRKHIDLNWANLDTYGTLRSEIVGYVENVGRPQKVQTSFGADAQSLVRQDGGGKGGGKNAGGKAGGGGGGSSTWTSQPNPDKDKECFHCGKKGHIKANCWMIDTPKDQLQRKKPDPKGKGKGKGKGKVKEEQRRPRLRRRRGPNPKVRRRRVRAGRPRHLPANRGCGIKRVVEVHLRLGMCTNGVPKQRSLWSERQGGAAHAIRYGIGGEDSVRK